MSNDEKEGQDRIYEAIRSKIGTAIKGHDIHSILWELISNSLTAKATDIYMNHEKIKIKDNKGNETYKYRFIYRDNGKGVDSIYNLFNKRWSKNLDIGYFIEGFTDAMCFINGPDGIFKVLSKSINTNIEQLQKISINKIHEEIKKQNKKDKTNDTDNNPLKDICRQHIKYRQKPLDTDDCEEKKEYENTKSLYFKDINTEFNNGLLFCFEDIPEGIFNALAQLNIDYLKSRYNKTFKLTINDELHTIDKNHACKM